MCFQEALETLGLNANFNEQELKKAYRSLAKQYHPDNYVNKSEAEQKQAKEKMQKINEAYDKLNKYLKNNFGSRSTSNNSKASEYVSELSKYRSKTIIREIREEVFKIDSIINMFLAEVIVDLTVGINSASSKLQATKDEIKKVFEELKERIYSWNDIPKEYLIETLNYECSIDEFYNQLLKIKASYDKVKEAFKKRLDDEIYQYTLYNINEERKKLVIFVGKHNAEVYASQTGYKDLDKIIEDMHKEIKEGFEEINSVEAKIQSLETEIANTPNEELKNKLSELKNDYEKGRALSDIIDLINELEKLVSKYQNINKNSELLKGIYTTVLNNYSTATKEYLLDSKKIMEAKEVLMQFLDDFGAVLDNQLDISTLESYLKVTFKDLEQDRNLISDLKEVEHSLSGIYVANSSKSPFLIGKITDSNPNFVVLFARNNNLWIYMSVPKKIFEENFISLEEFLANSEFIGKPLDRNIFLLYQSLYFSILHHEGNIAFLSRPFTNYWKTTDSEIIKYQDKEVMKAEIIRLIDEQMIQYEREKHNTNKR